MEMGPVTHPRREASRVLLIDAQDRLLLLRAGGWWFTVGGGIEAGETSEDAAIREAYEETGIRLEPHDLGPVVHERILTVQWNGGLVEQHEQFRVARVRSDAVSTAGLEPYELASLEGVRWWTHAELRGTSEPISPSSLPDLLERATTR